MDDIIGKFVKHIAKTKYNDIPLEMVDLTKKCIVDTMGVLLAGTSSAEAEMVTALVNDWSGKEESTVINHGFRVPVHHAALANGTMARVADLDNIHERACIHVHASIIPSAFSMAEKIGAVSGKTLLTAIILGTDILCRMGLSNKIPTAISGMTSTYQYGTFGVAAACGKLLDLDENKLCNTMGIAYSLVSGNSQCLREGKMTTRLGQGTCAQAGVLSAMLAQKGFTGVENVLQGKFGYLNCYQKGKYYLKPLIDELGKRFEGLDVTFKQYSCCLNTHSAIEGTLSLLEKHDLKPEDIEEINIGVNQQAYNIVVEPLETKYDPHEIAAAQFSIPFTQGTAIVKRKVFIDDFTLKEIRNPQVLEIAKKVNVYVDLDIERGNSGKTTTPAKVEIVTKDGIRYNKRVDFIKGHPNNPITIDEIIEKFKLCNSFAKNPLSEKSVGEFIGIIQELEKLSNVSKLIRLLG